MRPKYFLMSLMVVPTLYLLRRKVQPVGFDTGDPMHLSDNAKPDTVDRVYVERKRLIGICAKDSSFASAFLRLSSEKFHRYCPPTRSCDGRFRFISEMFI